MIASFGYNYWNSVEQIRDNEYGYIYDTTGSNYLIECLFGKLSKNSDLVLVGQPRLGSSITLLDPLRFFDGRRIYATQGGRFVPEKHLEKLVSLVERNIPTFAPLITHRIGLNEINRGFELMRSGQSGRVVVQFGGAE